MGASGSGKTTILNMVSAIDRVSQGHIYYKNIDITKMRDEELAQFRKDSLGFVFQNFNLLDTLTMEENIMLALAIRGEGKNKVIQETERLMKELGVHEVRKKFPYQVSGGQKQHCACIRAIITHPKLVMADEPTGALDSKATKILMETFQRMNETYHATIMMVTHDAYSASFCHRILFVQDGKIIHELKREKVSQKEFLYKILDDSVMTEGDEDAL